MCRCSQVQIRSLLLPHFHQTQDTILTNRDREAIKVSQSTEVAIKVDISTRAMPNTKFPTPQAHTIKVMDKVKLLYQVKGKSSQELILNQDTSRVINKEEEPSLNKVTDLPNMPAKNPMLLIILPRIHKIKDPTVTAQAQASMRTNILIF